ncbi:MAG: ABC transporter substrate-binding protein [Chloroflexi bacterium]|nr:ABC transporter substrate-binding protein [Chloroflexota bacterium]
MRRSHRFMALAGAAMLALAACTPSGSSSESPGASSGASAGGSAGAGVTPATVQLQLQWLDQSQFSGYYAADAQGYYAAEGITVTFLPGGGTVSPQEVGSQPNGPEFSLAWVPKVLQAREAGSDLVQIAQMFQEAPTLSVSWKNAGITSPADFKSKKVGAWPFGNELEVVASATIAGLKAGTDYTRVEQDFDMSELIAAKDGCDASATNCVDVAEAMIYNEWAQLLEATDPDTGKLYQPEQFNVINYNDIGTAMLQDSLWARASWLAEAGNEDVATRFLRASFKGWIYCRESPDDCVQYALDHGSVWGKGHLAWMMNEVNALVWPSPDGIGALDTAKWDQTIETATAGQILTKAPTDGAYRTDLADAARAGLDDPIGTDWTKPTVEVTPGGE